jgi:hypothetical protein
MGLLCIELLHAPHVRASSAIDGFVDHKVKSPEHNPTQHQEGNCARGTDAKLKVVDKTSILVFVRIDLIQLADH